MKNVREQTERARQIIASVYYPFDSYLSDNDVWLTLQNLARKMEIGTVDDKQEMLYVRLEKAGII